MSKDYIIDWSDAHLKPPFTVPGNTFDSSTDLTLEGDEVWDWGEGLNEDFLRLLEHFAGNSPPDNPTEGQLWFKSQV